MDLEFMIHFSQFRKKNLTNPRKKYELHISTFCGHAFILYTVLLKEVLNKIKFHITESLLME